MRARYHPPKPLKTYAARRNALREAEEVELIQYGMAIGLRLMAFSVNRTQHIANERLLNCFAFARYTFETEFKDDPEYAAETLMLSLDKAMGEGGDQKADELCEKWRRENETK